MQAKALPVKAPSPPVGEGYRVDESGFWVAMVRAMTTLVGGAASTTPMMLIELTSLAMSMLVGRVAIVTGGASGIGRALAHKFTAEGMRVMITDVAEEPLAAVGAELAELHGSDNVATALADVRDSQAMDDLAVATFHRFGAAHVVCNNAGVAIGGLTWTVPPAYWRWIVDVNLLGVANGIRSFVPRLIEQGEGHIVNVASVAGLITGPAMAPYFATKHAVVALSESLHHDLQLIGSTVGVSVVCPGWVKTRIAEFSRNRPADLAPADGVNGGDVAAYIQGKVEGGIDPGDVADKVLEAVVERRFWVLTHEDSLPSAKRRWAAIEAESASTEVR